MYFLGFLVSLKNEKDVSVYLPGRHVEESHGDGRLLHVPPLYLCCFLQWSSQDSSDQTYQENARLTNLAHFVAQPALLCHKEPAQGIQSLGAFIAFRWFFMA